MKKIRKDNKKYNKKPSKLNKNKNVELETEGKKSKYTWIKQFYTTFSLYIDTLYTNGLQMYFFTVMLTKYSDSNSLDSDYFERNKHVILNDFKEKLNEKIELIEFTYISIEKTKNAKNKIPHLHGILAVRSIIGRNTSLILQIKRELFNIEPDVDVKEIKDIKFLRTAFNYVVKEHCFESHFIDFYGSFQFDYLTKQINEDIINKLKQQTEIVEEKIEGGQGNVLICSPDGDKKSKDFINIVSLCVHTNNQYSMIKHNGMDRRKKEKDSLIYLFEVYFILNDLIISRNYIYKKDKNSRFTWTYVAGIEYLKDNFQRIIAELKDFFKMQLENIDIKALMINELSNAIKIIKQTNNVLPSGNVLYNAIEFKDGIYFIDANYFFNFYEKSSKKILSQIEKNNERELYSSLNNNNNGNDKIKTKLKVHKRYDTYYKKLEKPKHWLNYIGMNLQFIRNPQEIEQFCLGIGRFIQTEFMTDRKDTSILIIGRSNTGKTLLITNVLIHLIGIENVGFIDSHSLHFGFENVIDKRFILCDEFEYNPGNRSLYLKVLSNEPVSLNRKGLAHTDLKPLDAGAVFITNQRDNDEDYLSFMNDKAFLNRFKVYKFDNVIRVKNDNDEAHNREIYERLKYLKGYVDDHKKRPKAARIIYNDTYEAAKAEIDNINYKYISVDMVEKIKNEYPAILVHCNDLFFRKIKSDKTQNRNVLIREAKKLLISDK